jgi:addiction module RelE/StbE family toxin
MLYDIHTANAKAEKRLMKAVTMRRDIRSKLDRLRKNPRKEVGAHPLHGRLAGKWSCWLGSNLRMIYSIDDAQKKIVVEAVGPHNIY